MSQTISKVQCIYMIQLNRIPNSGDAAEDFREPGGMSMWAGRDQDFRTNRQFQSHR